jgi:uncharacterized repeat protein (TIGR03943 family)
VNETARDDAKMTSRPVVMRRSDGALLLGCLGALTLWLGLGDGMLHYLRSSMRPWLVLAGACVTLLAIATGVSAWLDERRDDENDPREGHQHEQAHRPAIVGWLLVVPLLVAIGISPGALGAYAVRQGSAFTTQVAGDFDLAAHLRTHSFGGQTPELRLREFLAAAQGDEDEQALLASTRVQLVGFIVNHPNTDHPLQLARLMIGCCAGDAIALVVNLEGDTGPPLDDETWVEVTGTFDRGATARAAADDTIESSFSVLRVESVRQVDAPREPYELPR